MEMNKKELLDQLSRTRAFIRETDPIDPNTVKQIFGTIARYPGMEISFVLLHNPTNHAWRVKVPEQRGAGASVEYESGFCEDGYSEIGNIHTHPNMGAFWSGVDRTDQGDTVGMYAVIGTRGGKPSEFKCTIITDAMGGEKNNRIDVDRSFMFGDVDPAGDYEANEEWCRIISRQAYKPLEKKVSKFVYELCGHPAPCREPANKPAYTGVAFPSSHENLDLSDGGIYVEAMLTGLLDAGYGADVGAALVNMADRLLEECDVRIDDGPLDDDDETDERYRHCFTDLYERSDLGWRSGGGK